MENSKNIIKNAEKSLQKEFEVIEEIRDFNQEKVLNAFIENRVAPEHFYTVSGYGHDDLGREVLDKVFASIFKTEKALVRIHFASGTHTLACALFGNLKYGDKLLSVAVILPEHFSSNVLCIAVRWWVCQPRSWHCSQSLPRHLPAKCTLLHVSAF